MPFTATSIFSRTPYSHSQRQHHDRLVSEPQPIESIPRPRATFQRCTDQISAKSTLDIRAGPNPQHVKRHQLGRVAQRLSALVSERIANSRPD